MSGDTGRPQINISKIVVSGGLAGAFFAISSMLIFLMGIPLLRYMFPAAIVLGCGVALFLHFREGKPAGSSWILPARTKL